MLNRNILCQVRDKLSGNVEKHVKAGPGTGSMGGKCSVCGDRATKVTTIIIINHLDIIVIIF